MPVVYGNISKVAANALVSSSNTGEVLILYDRCTYRLQGVWLRWRFGSERESWRTALPLCAPLAIMLNQNKLCTYWTKLCSIWQLPMESHRNIDWTKEHIDSVSLTKVHLTLHRVNYVYFLLLSQLSLKEEYAISKQERLKMWKPKRLWVRDCKYLG